MAGEMAALVGRNIRLAREQQALYNHRELAEEIRKRDPQLAATNQRVSDWERGIQKPTDRYMRLVSDILEQPVSWFYEKHGQTKTPELFEEATPASKKTPDQRLTAIEEELRGLTEVVSELVAGVAALTSRAVEQSSAQRTSERRR